MIPVIDVLSQEGLFICVIAVLLNIIVAYGYPIVHSYLPDNVKNIFNSYQTIILSHRSNLIASSLFTIVMVICTIVLAPILEKFLQMNQQTQPSIFNLAKLTLVNASLVK